MKKLGNDTLLDRDLFFLSIDQAGDLPSDFTVPSEYFACFLAWDSQRVDVEVISRVAEVLLDAGCAYLCAWGPGCGRVHDVFDEVEVGPEPDLEDESVVMTTWHNNESLDEALWFFLNNALPDAKYEDGCRAAVAISIGSEKAHLDRIEFALRFPRRFASEVVGKETT